MVDTAPWFLFVNHHDDSRGSPANNMAMVDSLRLSRTLQSPECSDAFLAIDRRHFWPESSGERELVYADMPLRSGRLHLSAPHIYAKALESLMPLKPGMSFLNVGSGTGYFNSIVSELIGDMATNHGIDIWPDTVAHARRSCTVLGKPNIDFTIGNVYQLDVGMTMRYDRIYLGACANSRSKYLYRLLEVGGILIGPFQVGHSQQLRRVVRQTESHFLVEVLGSVQFASLVEPTPPPAAVASPGTPRQSQLSLASATTVTSEGAAAFAGGGCSTPTAAAEDSGQPAGLPGVPFTFSLNERPWTRERCWLYPASFRRTVLMGLMCWPHDKARPCLPAEIWVKHIFPLCPKWWFEPAMQPAAPSLGGRAGEPAAPLAFAPPPRVRPKAEGTDDSDDGSSTRAPSSRASSAQVTPETEPSQPPAGIEADMGQISAGEPVMDPGNILAASPGTLFEVFNNGQRHAIGTEGDPDDMDYEGPRLAVPIRLLQMLAAGARRRRRSRHDMEQDEMEESPVDREEREEADEDEQLQQLEEPIEEAMANAQQFEVAEMEAADSDADMMAGEDSEAEDESML